MLNIYIDHLKVLVGEQLSSVIFVQDYLQLDFDGSKMTCYKFPTVKLSERFNSFGDISYRNDLCSFISHNVIDIISTAEKVILVFEEGEIFFEMPGEKEVIYFVDHLGKWSYYPVG